MHDDFETREPSRHPPDRRGVIEGEVRRRRASHQKNRRLPILQGFVDRPEQRIVERPGGFAKPRLEIDCLQFKPTNSALRLVHSAPTEPLWIDRPHADKLAMARDKRVDLIIVVADRRRVAANHDGRDKARFTDLGDIAFLGLRANKMLDVFRARPRVEPPRGLELRRVPSSAVEVVKERRTIPHIDNSKRQVDPPGETATGKARRTNRSTKRTKYTNIIDILPVRLSERCRHGGARRSRLGLRPRTPLSRPAPRDRVFQLRAAIGAVLGPTPTGLPQITRMPRP